MRTANNRIRIYTTTIETPWRNYSLWYDHQYRNAMVWQMCGYNQPPHASYFLGELEGITIAPPPLTNEGRIEVMNGGTITENVSNALTYEEVKREFLGNVHQISQQADVVSTSQANQSGFRGTRGACALPSESRLGGKTGLISDRYRNINYDFSTYDFSAPPLRYDFAEDNSNTSDAMNVEDEKDPFAAFGEQVEISDNDLPF